MVGGLHASIQNALVTRSTRGRVDSGWHRNHLPKKDTVPTAIHLHAMHTHTWMHDMYLCMHM